MVVDLQLAELDPFVAEMRPEGIFICVATHNEEQEHAVIRTLEKWAH